MNILLKRRHLKLLTALKAAGIGVSFDDDDNATLMMPAARFMGWIAMRELEPQLNERVILRTRHGNVFEGWRCNLTGPWDYTDAKGHAHTRNNFTHWMTKP